MGKTFAISLLGILLASGANAASNWTLATSTVCRRDPTECYTKMGIGYESQIWDNDAKCWGQKLICPEALDDPNAFIPVAKTINDIKKNNGINPDFDTDVLNGDCFGVRRTSANGSMAYWDEEMVPVWCENVPVDWVADVPNGLIADPIPSCRDLADWGFIAIEEDGCYGKEYDYNQYYIECNNDGEMLPSRIIILNGAEYITGTNANAMDTNAADDIFDEMESVSERQRGKYFTNN